MAIRNPAGWLQLRDDHTSENDRLMINSLLQGDGSGGGGMNFNAGGVRYDDGNAFWVKQTSTASMNVQITPGIAYVLGTQGGTQGLYTVINDAILSQAINTADPTNPRSDIVFVRVQDGNYSGTVNAASIGYSAGTPGVGAPPPTAPANSLVLAQISVPAGASTITTARITDKRQAVVAAGGVLPISPANGMSYPGAFEGRLVYNMDTNKLEAYNGSSWQSSDPVIISGKGAPNVGMSPGDDHDTTFNITIPRAGRLLMQARIHLRLSQASAGASSHQEMFYAGVSMDAQDVSVPQINAAGTTHFSVFLQGTRDVSGPGTVAIILRANNSMAVGSGGGTVLYVDYSFSATLGAAGAAVS
jgi:hypothetical protein